MVASGHPRSFSSIAQPDIDGDTRKVCPYPGDQPALIPLWKEHISAALDDANVLSEVLQPEIDLDAWVQANVSRDLRAATSKHELVAKYAAEYREPRQVALRTAYNKLIRWPGVLDHGMLDTIHALGLDKQRDGKQLLDLLLEPGDLSAEPVQIAFHAEIAKVHAIAYDPATALPFSSEQPAQPEVLAFLESYWSAIRHTDPKGISADPTTFVKTSLLVLKRLPELKFTAEWYLQTYDAGGYPKTGRDFIRTLKLRMLSTSLSTETTLIPFDLSTAHSPTLATISRSGPPRHGDRQLAPNRSPWQRPAGARPTGANGRPAPRPNTCDFCDARGCSGMPGGLVTECACCSPDDKNFLRYINKNASEAEKKHIVLGRKAFKTGKRKNLKGVHPRELLATIFAVVCDTSELSAQLSQLSEDDEPLTDSFTTDIDADELVGSMNALISEVTGVDLEGFDLSELGLSHASLGVLAASTSAASSALAANRASKAPIASSGDKSSGPSGSGMSRGAHATAMAGRGLGASDASSSSHALDTGGAGGFTFAPSRSEVPTAEALDIPQSMYDALFSFTAPGSLAGRGFSSVEPIVELRKADGCAHLVTFSILTKIHGHADAVHQWLSALPMGLYSVSDAADLLDPDSVELFEIDRQRTARDGLESDATPSSYAPGFASPPHRGKSKLSFSPKLAGTKPSPTPFYPASLSGLVRPREDQPAWRRDAISDLERRRVELATSRKAASGEPSELAPPHHDRSAAQGTLEDDIADLEARLASARSQLTARSPGAVSGSAPSLVELPLGVGCRAASLGVPQLGGRPGSSAEGTVAPDPEVAPAASLTASCAAGTVAPDPEVAPACLPSASTALATSGSAPPLVKLPSGAAAPAAEVGELRASAGRADAFERLPISAKQRKRAIAKKKKDADALEEVFEEDGLILELNDEPTPRSKSPVELDAASSSSHTPAPTTDSGSDSQRESISSSPTPAGSTSCAGSELSPLGAVNAAKDLAYLHAMPPVVQRVLRAFVSEIHGLGIYGSLEYFVRLDLVTVDSIAALSDARIDALGDACSFEPPALKALVRHVRYIQHAKRNIGAQEHTNVNLGGALEEAAGKSSGNVDRFRTRFVALTAARRITRRARSFLSLKHSSDRVKELERDAAATVIAFAIARRFYRCLNAAAREASAEHLESESALEEVSERVLSASAALELAKQKLDDAIATEALEQERLEKLRVRKLEYRTAADNLYQRLTVASRARAQQRISLFASASAVADTAADSPRIDDTSAAAVAPPHDHSALDSDHSEPPFVAFALGSVGCAHCGAIGVLGDRCSTCRKIIVKRKLRESTVHKQHAQLTQDQPPDLRKSLSADSAHASAGALPQLNDDGSYTVVLDGNLWSRVLTFEPNQYGHYAVTYNDSDLPDGHSLGSLGIRRGDIILKCGALDDTDPARIRSAIRHWTDLQTCSLTLTLRRLKAWASAPPRQQLVSSSPSTRAAADVDPASAAGVGMCSCCHDGSSASTLSQSVAPAPSDGSHVICLVKARVRDKVKLEFDYSKSSGLVVGRLRSGGIAAANGNFFVGQKIIDVDSNVWTSPGDLVRYINSRSADVPIRFRVCSLPGKA